MDKFRIDTHKLHYHPDRVSALVEAKNDWNKHKDLKPIYAEISSSGSCNHRCTFCSVDYIGYKPIFLNRSLLKEFFESASNIGLKSVMFAGDGEPLLNKEISDIVNDAALNGIDTSFTTNGVYLNSEFIRNAIHNVSWIKISMNAGNENSYEAIHRTRKEDFNKVWENIDNFVSHRKENSNTNKCAIGLQSLLLPDNIDTLDELCERAIDHGVDYVVLKPYVHNVYMKQEGYKDSLDYSSALYRDTVQSLSEKYKNAKDFNFVSRFNALDKLRGEVERYKTCWSTPALWFYISCDGSVYGCGAHVGNENFKLGNIKEESIENIWKSPERKKCLEYVQTKLDLNDCRRTCRMDEPNRYLYDIIEGNVLHKNFI